MTTQNFLIGPVKDGLRKDIKPWAIPEDSFEMLTNAYQFRGRIVKRSGYTLLGNLANGTPVMGLRTKEDFAIDAQTLVAFDTTTAYEWNGTAFVVLPSVMPVVWSGTDYQFFFTTNYANAFWATNGKPGLNGISIINAIAGGGITTITTSGPHGFTSGQTVFLINLGGVTGINGNGYVITVTAPNMFTIPVVAGGAYTSRGFALNAFVSTIGQDGIRYYGILSNGTGWANYNPPIDPNNALAGALLIFPYRGYLVFLNTTEGNDAGVFNYPNRARWTAPGTPYYSPPVPIFPNPQGINPNAARDDLFGAGGATDAPTNETIVAAGFIRDILVVYFERSTWRLRFVNNAQNPFVWERVNIELGSDCTFSTIPFDKGLMAIGNRGIVISDGVDTSRFDEKIPDEIFNIRQTNNGFQRVYGIRTFRTKLNYWTFPSAANPLGIYPDQVLVFNYDTKNWSFFDDTFTCFGYYYPSTTGYTWGDLTDAWASYNYISWNSGVSEAEYENIVAGNQQGFVFILEQTNGQNSPSLNILSITAAVPGVFTSTNNNLPDGTWITLTGVTGTTSDDGVSLNGRNFKLSNPGLNANTFTLSEFKSIDGGAAVGASYTYTVSYKNIQPGSIQINIGTLVFVDTDLDGILHGAGGTGTINYQTGKIILNFSPPILSTEVFIRVVSLDPLQGLSPVATIGGYSGGGQITKISGLNILSKFFNFFGNDQKSRLSKIDFYVDSTEFGQVSVNVFGDSSNNIINIPLSDNPLQNVLLTSPHPYQVGAGEEVMSRLYCDSTATTLQLQINYSDVQLAINAYNRADFELLCMIFSIRPGGRLI
jgi:hypothetical protein